VSMFPNDPFNDDFFKTQGSLMKDSGVGKIAAGGCLIAALWYTFLAAAIVSLIVLAYRVWG